MSIPARLVSMITDSVDPLEARRIEKEMNGEVKRMLEAFVVAGAVEKPEAGKSQDSG